MRYLLWICTIFVVIIAYVAYTLNKAFNFFAPMFPYTLPSCDTIITPRGPEHLVQYGNLILSAVDDRIKIPRDPLLRRSLKDNGMIIAIDIFERTYREVPLEGFPKTKSFHPLGFSLYQNRTLYVINNDYISEKDTIEVFELTGMVAKYMNTITFTQQFMSQLNSVHVITEDSFYVTTSAPESNYFNRSTIKDFLSMGKMLFIESTHINHCTVRKGVAECSKQDSGNMMNGLASDGKYVYATDSIKGTLNQYEVKSDNATLVKVDSIDLGTKGDNIVYDAVHGKIYVATLRLQDFMNASEKINKGEYAMIPAGVVELSMKNGKWVPRLLFMQNKQSGTSTVLRIGEKIVLGSWLDSKIMVCPLIGYYGK